MDAFGPSYNVGPKCYTGRLSHSFHARVRYSRDGRYITAGSEDGKGYIWEVRKIPLPLPICSRDADLTFTLCASDVIYRLMEMGGQFLHCRAIMEKSMMFASAPLIHYV